MYTPVEAVEGASLAVSDPRISTAVDPLISRDVPDDAEALLQEKS